MYVLWSPLVGTYRYFWSWRSAGIMSSGLFDPASLQPDVFDVWGLGRSGGPKVKLKVSLRKIIVFLPQWFIAPADWCFTRLPQGAGTSHFFESLDRGTTERTLVWKCKGLRQQCVFGLGFHEVKKWTTVTASPLIKYLCGQLHKCWQRNSIHDYGGKPPSS